MPSPLLVLTSPPSPIKNFCVLWIESRNAKEIERMKTERQRREQIITQDTAQKTLTSPPPNSVITNGESHSNNISEKCLPECVVYIQEENKVLRNNKGIKQTASTP